MSDWPEGAAELVLAIADTKLLLGHRYAQWTLGGPSLEDDMGGASAAQEEIGHVRQLFRLLAERGFDAAWLEGDREPTEFRNAACLDRVRRDWAAFLATAAPADRAAWYLLDAIDHDDLRGLVARIGEDEYFHLEYHDARLETLADDEPATVRAAFESALPAALAFVGPASHDADGDPLFGAFTDRPVADVRAALIAHYESLFDGTDVSLDGVDVDGPAPEAWDPVRRRVGGGGPDEADLEQLTGARNREFAVE